MSLDTPPTCISGSCHQSGVRHSSERNAMRSKATNGMESRNLPATGSRHNQGDLTTLSRAKLINLNCYKIRDAARDDSTHYGQCAAQQHPNENSVIPAPPGTSQLRAAAVSKEITRLCPGQN